jgi:hypothetical protein
MRRYGLIIRTVAIKAEIASPVTPVSELSSFLWLLGCVTGGEDVQDAEDEIGAGWGLRGFL